MELEAPTSRGSYLISTDPSRLDTVALHAALGATYWAVGRSLETVLAAVAGSMNFGLYAPDGRQVGYARVVTDRATFGWLCDVYVLDEHRGLGLGKALMAAVTGDPELSGIRRLMLATDDAHGLYAQFGFEPLDEPRKFMARRRGGGDT